MMIDINDAFDKDFHMVIHHSANRRFARLIVNQAVTQLVDLRHKRGFKNFTSRDDELGQDVGVPFFDY